MILALLLGGVPIFAALGSVGVLGIYLVYGGMPALSAIPNVAYGSLDSFSLACLPLFILTGHILAECGVGQELFDMCSKWTRGLPGGSAIATILACMVFAAISTSSVATATTIGLIALPELARRGYNKNFSYGALAAGGTLGIMIPPSGSMIIYSAVTEESLGRLFMAGIIPGIILGIFFSIYCTIYCKSTGQYEKMERVSWQEKVSSLKTGVWGLITPGIIMGGIYSGIFTPLETGGMAALYSICVAMARRKLRGRDIITLLRAAAISTGMLFAIITGALIMGVYVTYLQVPQLVINLITDLDIPNWNVIAMLMGLYIFLGLFLEVVSAMMITLPIVYPLIITLGCDGIWFAVLITLNMEMALITPPVGLNLFVIQGIAKAPLYPVIRGVTPFFLLMCVGLLIVAFFPGLSTWLPSVMVK
jgi:C4-dicarboxylate transporter DctM subunit